MCQVACSAGAPERLEKVRRFSPTGVMQIGGETRCCFFFLCRVSTFFKLPVAVLSHFYTQSYQTDGHCHRFPLLKNTIQGKNSLTF